MKVKYRCCVYSIECVVATKKKMNQERDLKDGVGSLDWLGSVVYE